MSLLETIFPALNEIWLPVLLIAIGIAIILLLGWIPIIGFRLAMIGAGFAVLGIIYWIVSVKFKDLLNNMNYNYLIAAVLTILLIIIGVLTFRGKK